MAVYNVSNVHTLIVPSLERKNLMGEYYENAFYLGDRTKKFLEKLGNILDKRNLSQELYFNVHIRSENLSKVQQISITYKNIEFIFKVCDIYLDEEDMSDWYSCKLKLIDFSELNAQEDSYKMIPYGECQTWLSFDVPDKELGTNFSPYRSNSEKEKVALCEDLTSVMNNVFLKNKEFNIKNSLFEKTFPLKPNEEEIIIKRLLSNTIHSLTEIVEGYLFHIDFLILEDLNNLPGSNISRIKITNSMIL